MKRAILFLKATIPGGAGADLFAAPVQVHGHMRGASYVAPYTARRDKVLGQPTAADAAYTRERAARTTPRDPPPLVVQNLFLDMTNRPADELMDAVWAIMSVQDKKVLADMARRRENESARGTRASLDTRRKRSVEIERVIWPYIRQVRAQEDPWTERDRQRAARYAIPPKAEAPPAAATAQPGAPMGSALAALAPTTVYGEQAWQDAWERATPGERARMEHYAAEAATAKAAGHAGTQRRSLERLDIVRAGIMERAVREARDEFHAETPRPR